MKRRYFQRRGYALMLVMLFVVLFSAILGVAWQRVASSLRSEHVGEVRKQCDRGSVQALAQAVKVLESRLRRNASSPNEFLLEGVAPPAVPIYVVPWQWQWKFGTRDISNDSYVPGSPDHSDLQWYIVTFSYNGTRWKIDITSQKTEPALDAMPNPL